MEGTPAMTVAKILPSFVLVLIVYSVKAELFTSIEYLNRAIEKAEIVANSLENYIRHEEARLNKLKLFSSYLSERQRHLLKSSNNTGDNPISVYKFVQIYAEDWDRHLHEYLTTSKTEELEYILDIKDNNLPSFDDLQGVIDGIVRLQNTYKLSSAKIANGSIDGHYTGRLSAKDCFTIGRNMFNKRYFSKSVEWYQVSLDRAKQDVYWDDAEFSCYDNSQFCRGQGVNAIQSSAYIPIVEMQHKTAKEQFEMQKNNFTQDMDQILSKLQSNPDVGFLVENVRDELLAMYKKGEVEYYGKEIISNMKSRQIYESLCRGEQLPLQYVPYIHPMEKVCMYFDNHRHPLLVLQPVKMEILNPDPYIVIYHDIITDKEIKVFKNDTYRSLVRSEGIPANPKHAKDGKEMDERISRLSFLIDEHPTVHKFYNRLEAIISLKVRYPSAEILQIGNYGFGGQYEPHYDFLGPIQRPVMTEFGSERLVTVLLYLSDVKAGGATVFPSANVYIPPIKGAAAFWLNVDVDLNGDTRTLHAGCPVLLGSKWIANKWVHSYHQDIKCYL